MFKRHGDREWNREEDEEIGVTTENRVWLRIVAPYFPYLMSTNK